MIEILTAMEAYEQTKANRETVSEGLLLRVDSEIRNAIKFGKSEVDFYMSSTPIGSKIVKVGRINLCAYAVTVRLNIN